MIKNRILILENESRIIEFVQQMAHELGLECVEFKPQGEYLAVDLCEELENTLKVDSFDFVLLDYKLWRDVKGIDFVVVLKKMKVPFAGFSEEDYANEEFTKQGAVSVFLKGPVVQRQGGGLKLFLEDTMKLVV